MANGTAEEQWMQEGERIQLQITETLVKRPLQPRTMPHRYHQPLESS